MPTTTAAPRQLATPNDLGDDAAKAISEALNPLVADAFALYIKTKNYHWHLSGSHFRDYHLLLDEQADEIFLMTDVLAERVRRVGGTTIRSVGQVARLSSVEDSNEEYLEPLQMLRNLVEENKNFAARQRAAHEVCDEQKDVASASLLENFIDQTEKRTWFLYENTVGGPNTN